eukprot:CAMPEP_0119419854 /NCGR_PEP_ID=MMETSP1335-20130426/21940_1 /TAXON_ID=259385 /ORGANISM="Chrysoculter rhomboideus, Strain RCC1486" /LENGTH=128 /DNA_ID=CAMNT_0007445181 /DNA_START=356 /DNA_END=738 /DNA_ORIENTATION=+
MRYARCLRGGVRSLDQLLHHHLHVEVADVSVRLSDADEDDGLARDVHHRDGGADLVVDRVKLGEHDAIDQPGVAHAREVLERLVELGHLVNRVVADQRLAHKEHEVRAVAVHQLGERAHERLVVLHPP